MTEDPVRGTMPCRYCHATQALDQFTEYARRVGYGRCRPCRERTRGYNAKWYAENKEQANAASADWERRNRARKSETQRVRRAKTGEKFTWDMQRRYGITPTEYAERLATQGGGCAVCGTDRCSDGRRLVVDHCHITGRVRGILCHRCNTGIGMLGDGLAGVRKALAYLASPPAPASCGQIPDSNLGSSAGLIH